MSRVNSQVPSSSEVHAGHMMGPLGHASSWLGFSGFQPTTSGAPSSSRTHHCDAGDWWRRGIPPASHQQQTSSIASEILGLVADAKTPADKAALISAAISILKDGKGQSDSRTEERLSKILGDLTHQIANSSGPSDPAKGQLLDGIAKILKQLTAQQSDANSSILNTLNQLVSQISHASSLDERTKNSILDKLSSIIQQLAQSSSGSPCHRSAGHRPLHATTDSGAE